MANRLPLPLLLLVATLSSLCAAQPTTFTNPLYRGADPWVIQKDGAYYLCQASYGRGVAVWKSPRLTDRGEGRAVWRAPRKGWNSSQIWAPELHYLRGQWYIYYAASNGDNANHRMGALAATSDDPQDDYEDRGMLYTGDDAAGGTNNRWAIDGTPLDHDGQLYFIWSGWPAKKDVQYLYIARMKNPWTISSDRARLCANDTHLWERVGESAKGRGLNEAPQILRRDDAVFLVYSCSGSWETTYKMNWLKLAKGGDPMDPGAWSKNATPAFRSSDTVWGVGHASFVRSPDGAGPWMLYHSKTSKKPGWRRSVSAQKFRWTRNGLPDFGPPIEPGKATTLPSGEVTSVAKTNLN